VSRKTTDSKSALVEIREGGEGGGENPARLVLRALLKLLKSMPQKSHMGGFSVCGMERSMVMMMGR